MPALRLIGHRVVGRRSLEGERRLPQQGNDRHISQGHTVSPMLMMIPLMRRWQILLRPLKVQWIWRMPATTTGCLKTYRATFVTPMPET